MKASRISLRGGSFRYGEHEIFGDLDFDLAAGDICCLLGPNGCGKTTLLRCLSGLLKLNSGEVLLDGRDLMGMSEVERARQLGFVFQEHDIHFPYSVSQIVQMGRAPHLGFFSVPSRQDMQIVADALAVVGIAHLQERRYTEISGGERQLALIARALAQQPGVLLLDEPTSHLDFGNQMLILETVGELARGSGLAVIMATHFPDHALLISNKVALMHGGRFAATGRPQDVISEDSLKALYGVDVQIIAVDHQASGRTRAVVPFLGGRTRAGDVQAN